MNNIVVYDFYVSGNEINDALQLRIYHVSFELNKRLALQETNKKKTKFAEKNKSLPYADYDRTTNRRLSIYFNQIPSSSYM